MAGAIGMVVVVAVAAVVEGAGQLLCRGDDLVWLQKLERVAKRGLSMNLAPAELFYRCSRGRIGTAIWSLTASKEYFCAIQLATCTTTGKNASHAICFFFSF